MSKSRPDDRSPLMPEGKRWGMGARSIVPYLYVSLLAKPFSGREGEEDFIRNPVFPHMDNTLRMLKRGH
ncbi:hypothetical protein HHL11_17565 [Ramlibacter sp. G-1-2-2]|uniref:Uncharacterized protein n=1 Tax=Ramlibacter agri TaxID=2728837 RepID=A0A848H445_9BURK|nr:hypothetical protein [Ramlibacter agri]NML45565.1 hypothetical protein [Ramlibacter agri]